MRPSRRLLIWLKTPGERGGAENLAVERLRGARAARVAKDPAFAAALLPRKTSRAAGIHTMLAGDVDTGKAILRDYIQATVDCEAGSQSGLALLVQGSRRTWYAGEDYHRREWRQQRSDRGLGSTRTLQIEARGKPDTSLMHTQIGHDMQSGETAQTAACAMN